MNKKNLIFVTIFSFTLLINLSESNAHTKIHNNYVYFTKDASSVSFSVTSHCITPGQPLKTLDGTQTGSAKYKKGMVGINIIAGRHNSKDVVNCIQKNMLPHIKNKSFFDIFTFYHYRPPATLNFAVQGILTINGKHFNQIILAQGYSTIRNNWWFGGSQCTRMASKVQKEKVECIASDGTKWCFLRGKEGNIKQNNPDHIQVKDKRCSD